MNVVTLYFAVWLVTERGATNTAYSVATSLSSVAVLLLAPWIGAVSDASRRRKRRSDHAEGGVESEQR